MDPNIDIEAKLRYGILEVLYNVHAGPICLAESSEFLEFLFPN